jgi:hypothetical protein
MEKAPIELKVQVELLEGTREAQDENEAQWLAYMGGIRGPREGWPTRWVVCPDCQSEYLAAGFPSPTGKWVFNPLCRECRKKPQPKPYKWRGKASKARKDLE